jgi:hypothetical protein
MRSVTIWTVILAAVVLALSAAAQPQTLRPPDAPSLENDIAFSNRAEEALTSSLATAHILAEAIFQESVAVDDSRYGLNRDRYILSRFDGATGPRPFTLLTDRGLLGRKDSAKSADSEHLLDAIHNLLTPDWAQLRPGQYEFTFVKNATVGTLHCQVYDVRPRDSAEGFTGRLYIETAGWNIVRFTGFSSRVDQALSVMRGKQSRFRVDVWRSNIAPDRWVTANVYIEEVAPLGVHADSVVKGQVRFWGYGHPSDPARAGTGELFLGDRSSASRDRSGAWSGPSIALRQAEKDAEENVVARFEQSHWMTKQTGEVEAMLDQVLTNLRLSNHIVGGPTHCRILLTAPLEVALVNNCVLVGREVVNTVPGESALGMVLAHAVVHSVLGHRKIDPALAFPDLLRIPDPDLAATLRFRHTEAEERAIGEKVMEILANSPYKDKKSMQDAGLFMQAVQFYRGSLFGLISSTFGEDLADPTHVEQDHPSIREAWVFNPKLPNQVAAKALGSRLEMDAADGRLRFFRQQAPDSPPALYERQEFGITPFLPYLDYFTPEAPAKSDPLRTVTPTRAPIPPRARPVAGHPVTSVKKGPA